MFKRVYLNKTAKAEEEKANHVVRALFKYYSEHIDKLPEEFKMYIDEDGEERIVADYIACMTDRYAVNDYVRIFVPKDWV